MSDHPAGVHVVRIDDVPWEPHVMGRSIRKVLDTDPSVDSYVHYRYSPPGGGNPKIRRLHLSISESFFFLSGSLPNWEFKSPEDTQGRIVDFDGGMFMDRLPFSVHGTGPDLSSPTGSTFLMWTSGGGEFEADTGESIAIPFEGVMPTFEHPYTDPIIVDSRSLEWRSHPRREGWKWRPLSTSAKGTITPRPVSVVYIPPDWHGSDELEKVSRRAFLFVLNGSMSLLLDGRREELGEGAYARWDPGSELTVATSSPVGCTTLVVGHDLAGS